MWPALVAALVGGSAAWLAASLPAVREEQIRRGLFGDRAREGLIGQWVDAAVAVAERQVRLGHFGASLRTRAWEGAVAEIGHSHHGRDSTWRFSSGELWRVDLTRAVPRSVRRAVVRSVEQRGPHLQVNAYVPGRLDFTLTITDACMLR